MSVDYILSWLLIGAFVTWVGIGIGYVVTKILDKIEDKKEKDFFKKWEKSYEKYTPNSVDCGDCSIRAFTKLYDVSWDEAFDMLAEHAKSCHTNMCACGTLLKWFEIHNFVIKDVALEKMGCIRFAEAAEKYKGYNSEHKVVLVSEHHMATAVDGVVYDSWDSRYEECTHIVYKDDSQPNPPISYTWTHGCKHDKFAKHVKRIKEKYGIKCRK